MPASEDAQRLFSEKIRELAWTRERLLLMPRSTVLPPTFAQSYESLEERKRALENEIAALSLRPSE